MNKELEVAFINKYVVKEKRQRYIGFIEKPTRRRDFLEMLYHGQDIDKSKYRRLDAFYERTILQQVGKLPEDSNCYIISVNKKLDGQEMSISAALKKLEPYTEGIVLIFGNCEVVYYQGEPPHNEWLSI
ncbi:hypothetical protein HER32_13675 [Hymenobacter sp. BT18]|uniref:hypothetical protein n=1 Tax=Hymenobacter sp. BT18 TaxID=2835648 RepID=UPI00143E1AC4|nr:hypothetical protein [Hymenobacter sp. BT18]QIX62174.1 hypothetical protein HER32_13675 [Hymenobacter sp. BT18]